MASLRRAFPKLILGFLIAGGVGGGSAIADTGHARIVRLSLVQGDVRFARDVKGDPLNDSSQLNWETAALNLPIRQGYVVATDNGRVEVEFENGALAFLAENTVLQFYDLSSEDGGLTTRLILRQGSAAFYVSPARGDYFSVTGGDFSVEAESKTTFRMNNFDDGSNVSVLHGRLTALANGKNTSLAKGDEFSVRAGEADSSEVARAGENDEFDQWAAARISTSLAATNASMQYSNGGGYVSGYGDLYTYGAWFPVAGYGNCWRPYGVGFGWSPFDNGSWYYDPFFGWSFLGGYSWGWLPYHYGGWIFQSGTGWVWSPSGTRGGPGLGRWQPVTGVWMRASNGTTGIVPVHPLDGRGKTPLNLSQGLYSVTTRGVTGQIAPQSDARWKVENKPGREVIQNQLAAASAPTRVSRTMVASTGAGARGANGNGSTIVFDRNEGRFVNSTNARSGDATRSATAAESGNANAQETQRGMKVYPTQSRSGNDARVPPATDRMNAREGQGRQVAPATRTVPSPPNVPRSVTNERAFNQAGGGQSGGGRSGGGMGASGASGGGGSGPSRGSASSGGGAGASSGGGGRSSGAGSSGGGGGRPH
ncbi:MAG TPA: FecR family protein [Candidatus Acidoferrum sp.]|nr:FecR family protein [Candidatus Acidoferrum sp.]